MDKAALNRCKVCAASPDARSSGVSDDDGNGWQTAVIECACGQKVERTTASEADAMPAAVAAWNMANSAGQ